VKNYTLLMIAAGVLPRAYANASTKREIVQELIQRSEELDPNIKSHRTEWLKVREHLERSAQESESIQGLKLSVQHILDQWLGLRFRVLDETDAQYWALTGEPLTLPRAWFQRMGLRWVVQYAQTDKLRRGDSFLQKDFNPFSAENQKATVWKLPLEKPIELPAVSRPLSAWSLDLTQSASQTLLIDNKKLCVEKVWFWLNSAVSENLASKIESGLCQAMLIDLREVVGEGRELWPSGKKKIPIVVLTNQGTREGAVRLATSLQKDSGAQILGEPTDSDRPVQKSQRLSTVAWNLVITGDGGQLRPNAIMRDSYLRAEGVDDLKEAGLAQLRKIILN
jgi:hypothetical protein